MHAPLMRPRRDFCRSVRDFLATQPRVLERLASPYYDFGATRFARFAHPTDRAA
jgi:hypothetical protein